MWRETHCAYLGTGRCFRMGKERGSGEGWPMHGISPDSPNYKVVVGAEYVDDTGAALVRTLLSRVRGPAGGKSKSLQRAHAGGALFSSAPTPRPGARDRNPGQPHRQCAGESAILALMAGKTTPPESPTPIVMLTTAKAGGAERALAHLVRWLPALGFDPTVLLLGLGPLQDWLIEEGCRKVVVPVGGEDLVELARLLIHRTRARLVLSSKWNAHRVGGPAARAAGVPAVWWQHDIARQTCIQVEAASHPAAAIVCSSELAIDAQRRLTPSARIVRIQPGVPVQALAERASRSPQERTALEWRRPPLVGIVGRLQEFKAQHVFLQAAALVAQRRRDVRFVVVGGAVLGTEADYPYRLRKLAAQLDLSARVWFVGQQSDVVPWLDALDIVVHATDGEPFGLVVVEAMAVGAPVIATNLGGPAEIIEDRRSGWLVPPREPGLTAQAILEILRDGELRGSLSAGGRRRARLFTDGQMSEQFASLFRSILRPQDGRSGRQASSRSSTS